MKVIAVLPMPIIRLGFGHDLLKVSIPRSPIIAPPDTCCLKACLGMIIPSIYVNVSPLFLGFVFTDVFGDPFKTFLGFLGLGIFPNLQGKDTSTGQ